MCAIGIAGKRKRCLHSKPHL